MVTISVKTFHHLSKQELYDILQLRTEVFVVEQNCVYQDIDAKDQKALHVILKKKEYVIGYTRIFRPGDYLEEASIGRVVVTKSERHSNYGTQLMMASIHAIHKKFNTRLIKISAQCYLEEFYKKLGFIRKSEPYLEDGIPHISMLLKD